MVSTQPAEQIEQALRQLVAAWETTRGSWRDAGATQFERNELAPIEQDVAMQAAMMRSLAEDLSSLVRRVP